MSEEEYCPVCGSPVVYSHIEDAGYCSYDVYCCSNPECDYQREGPECIYWDLFDEDEKSSMYNDRGGQ